MPSRRAFTVAATALAVAPSTWARSEVERRERLLMPGTRWETPLYEVVSGVSGPRLMITAGIHGNENAPPLAARTLLERRLRRGRLIVVPEVNRPALGKGSRHTPRARHPDLNRNFPTRSRPLPRPGMAGALWNATLSAEPDWVVDLHEGWGYSQSSDSMGSSIVRVSDERTDALTLPVARLLVDAINETVEEPRKRFGTIGPGPRGSYARAVVEQLGKPALVFESTWTEERELRVAKQVLLLDTLLAELGML